MNDLFFYLPGTADNLLFMTLAVLVLLMITGIYGYLNVDSHSTADKSRQMHWGWPALSLFALAVLFFWFGRPLSAETGSRAQELFVLISQFTTAFIVLGFGAAAVLSSDLKWSLTAATISFLTSGLLLLQAKLLPLVLLCWMILGGMVLLFLYRGIFTPDTYTNDSDDEGPFREPFLSCLACGLLLCGCLWVVHREWGSITDQPTAETEPAAKVEDLALVQQFLTAHWTTLILLLIFVGVSYVGITRLNAKAHDPDLTYSDEWGVRK
ncbi:hypothetical protein [Gimesia fumaroli]|uniref:Uncharacterized protein n=1 Tax=Gimesia fumaroli TaxID=2527976 RepID=A0A518I6W9_9PLAN|nr:hypothetical protein [Gimesia fumaroli]QDV48823.1 hypothetical protein Enr17x_08370 [Gimesia fumaroli]